MPGVDALSVSEAADKLRVSERRIRALAEARILPARKIAGRWIIDARGIEHRAANPRGGGRPHAPENAWGLLFLASGERAPWLSRQGSLRLRRALRRRELREQLPRLSGRAKTRYFAASAAALDEVRADPDFVPSGVSAADAYGADIRAAGVVEGYLRAGRLRHLEYSFALREVHELQANLILHAVDAIWPFRRGRLAPRAVVAADLAGSLSERTRSAGEQLLATLPSP